MFSIRNNELSALPVLGKTVTCWLCGQEHAVEYGEKVGEDGKRQPDDLLAFFKCGERSYLCGVKGKQLKKPKENIHHLDEYNRPMPQKIDHAALDEYNRPMPQKIDHAAAGCGAETARLRLTDAEREAVEQAATVADAACEEAKRWVGVPRWANGGVDDSSWQHVADSNAARAATLRGLLERLGGDK